MEIITTIMPGVERFTSKYEEESDYIQELARLNLSKKKGQWCLYISSIAFVSKTLQAIQLSEKTKCTDFFIYSEQKSFDCATIFFHYLCFYCVLLFFVFLLKISVLTAPQYCILLDLFCVYVLLFFLYFCWRFLYWLWFDLSVVVFFCFYFLYFCWRSLFWPRHKIVYSSINPISRTRKDCGNRLKGHRSIFSFWICTSSCVCILDFHIDLSIFV